MELYETDILELQKFMQSETETKFTPQYMILYDFAIDCRYSKCIQQDLFNWLLPYYYSVIEQAVVHGEKSAVDIYFEFNKTLFLNNDLIRKTVGEEKYKQIMEFYIKQVIACMKQEGQDVMEWVSLFNTAIALDSDNICKLFDRILTNELDLKYIFFKYLSVIIFRDSDNMLNKEVQNAFWSSDIWSFDDEFFGRRLFWREEAVKYFDTIISVDLIQTLFVEVKPILCKEFGVELVGLLEEELGLSIENHTFDKRKAEYLEKIACKSEKRTYWNHTI